MLSWEVACSGVGSVQGGQRGGEIWLPHWASNVCAVTACVPRNLRAQDLNEVIEAGKKKLVNVGGGGGGGAVAAGAAGAGAGDAPAAAAVEEEEEEEEESVEGAGGLFGGSDSS